MNGGTDIATALGQAGKMLKSEGAEVTRLVLLLTDGRIDRQQVGRFRKSDDGSVPDYVMYCFFQGFRELQGCTDPKGS